MAFRREAIARLRRRTNYRYPSALQLRAACVLSLCAVLFGCAASPKNSKLTTGSGGMADPAGLQLVSRLTRVWGTKPQRVDGVSLVVGLHGTGSDPPPAGDRDALLSEMQTRQVDKPNSVLASPSTALVRVTGRIPPGARKGDHFDLYVEVPRDTATTDIQGGWLMATRLHEFAMLGNRVGEGHLLAVGQGDVLTDALMEAGESEIQKLRGRILGGGIVTKSRGFGLVVRDQFTSVKTSARIGEAINRRFNTYHNGRKQGVANPTRDDFVELLVHPRYVGNESRYIRVIQNIAIRESSRLRSARLGDLRLALADPDRSETASIKLEAMGEDGVATLRDALSANDFMVRFFAAEALAYQDVTDAVDVLAVAVDKQPAFRARALQALGAMDDVASHEALVELMNSDSSEARYGAFRILRRRTPDDPMVAGVVMNDSFTLNQVNSSGPPMVHVSRIIRPEIVLFGDDHQLMSPVVLFAGRDIVVRDDGADGVTVARLSVGDEDDQVVCSRNLHDVIETVCELNGGYADVVRILTEAKRTGALQSRLEFSAIPTESRTYDRDLDRQEPGAEGGPSNMATQDSSVGPNPTNARSSMSTAIPSHEAEATKALSMNVEGSLRPVLPQPFFGPTAGRPASSLPVTPWNDFALHSDQGNSSYGPPGNSLNTSESDTNDDRKQTAELGPLKMAEPPEISLIPDELLSMVRSSLVDAPNEQRSNATAPAGAHEATLRAIAPLDEYLAPVTNLSDLVDVEALPD